jgi:aminoglycoside 2'-N-acetyltransferase I
MNHELEIVADEELSSDDADVLAGWAKELFGEEEAKFEWAPQHWHILVRYDGRLACHVGITDHVVSVGEQRLHVGGIGGVMTPREFQGKGLARIAMDGAADLMGAKLGVDFGLLLCGERLVPYYGRMHWQSIQAPLVFTQASGQIAWDEAAMYLPFKDTPWPEGPVDLCGLPW